MAARSFSPTEASPICPVCLRELANCKLGKPENCDHLFCFTCIFEWSKNVNTCPVDRIKFNNIEVLTRKGGKCINKVYVTDHTLTEVLQDPNEVTYCEVCHECTREDRLLLCDGCDKGFHMECLRPPISEVPAGDWYCPVCEPIVSAQRITAEELDNSAFTVNGEFSSSYDSDDESSFEPRRKTRRMGTQFQTSSSSESEQEEEDASDFGPHIPHSGNKRCGRLQILSEESSESDSDQGDDPFISLLSIMRKRKRQLRTKRSRVILESDMESNIEVPSHPTIMIQDPCCSRHLTTNLTKTSNHHSELSGYTSDESSREVVEETDIEFTEDTPLQDRNCRKNGASRKLYNTRSSAVEGKQPAVLCSEVGELSGSLSHSRHSTSERSSEPERTARRRKAAVTRGKNREQIVVSSDQSNDDSASIHSGYCSSGNNRKACQSNDLSSSMILHQSESDSEYVPDKTPSINSPFSKKISLRPRGKQGNVANSRMPLLDNLTNSFEESETSDTQCVRRNSRRKKIALRPRGRVNSRMPLLEGLPDDFKEHTTGGNAYSHCVRRKPASKSRRRKCLKGKKSRASSAAKAKGKGKSRSVSKGKGKQKKRRRRRKIRCKKPDPFTVTSPIRTRARTAATHTPMGSLFRKAVIESHQHENVNEGLQRARAVLNMKLRKESLQNTPFRSITMAMFGSPSASRVVSTPQSGYHKPLSLCSTSALKNDYRHPRADADSTPLSFGRLVGSLGQQGRANRSGKTDDVTKRMPLKRKLSMEVNGPSPHSAAKKLEETPSQSASVDLLGGICQGLDDLHNRNNIIRRDGTIQPIREDSSNTSPQKSSSAPLSAAAAAHKRLSSEGYSSEQSDDTEATLTLQSHMRYSRNRQLHPARKLTLKDHRSSAYTSDEASTATVPKQKLQTHQLRSHSTQSSRSKTSRSLSDSNYSTGPKPVENNYSARVPVTCTHDGITGGKDVDIPSSSNEESSERRVENLDRCTLPGANEAERTVRIALKGYYKRGKVTDREYGRILQRATKKAVPSSPQQQWSSDPGLSFHGLTPTKVYCDGDTGMTLPAPLARATDHQTKGSDVSGSMPHTGFSDPRGFPRDRFSTADLTQEQLDQSGEELSPSGGGASGLRPHLRDCRPPPQPKSLFPFRESVLPETSFSSVPSLAVEDPEEDDYDGLAEVTLTLSPSRPRAPLPLLPEPWSPPVMSPADEPSEPCAFDPSTFSIKLYYPREE